MTQLKMDKEKYLQIARTQGAEKAITELHRDMERWEFETFEGPEGYQPGMWKDLEEVRKFSRELWEIAISKK